MPAADRLSWYAEQFQMVEINSTFYAVPAPQMVERWCRSTPEGFVFDVKLHQLLSRHSTAAKLLPPAVRQRAEIDAKGKVKLTPEIEQAMIAEVLGPVRLFEAFGKLGALLLQMSPAFSPKGASVVGAGEVTGRGKKLSGGDRAEKQELGGRRTAGGDAAILSGAFAHFRGGGCARAESFHDHAAGPE